MPVSGKVSIVNVTKLWCQPLNLLYLYMNKMNKTKTLHPYSSCDIYYVLLFESLINNKIN